MPARFRRLTTSIRLVPVLAVLLAVGCGGGDDPTGPGGGGGGPLTISLALDAGAPGDLVKVTGLPADITGLYGEARVPSPAALTAAQDDPVSMVAILREPGGDDYVSLPLHPVSPMEGGAISLRITDGADVNSNEVEVALEGLTPAPGAFAAVVTSLEQLLDGWLAQLGTDRETLRSTPVASLPLMNAAILFVHNVVDNPDNPNSLRALADGDIPLFADTPLDRDLLDALTAQAGLQGWVDEKFAFVDTLTPPTLPAPLATVGMGSAEARQIGCIDAPTFDIGDCEKLAEVMAYQTGLELAKSSAADKVVNDITGAILAAAGFTPAAPAAAGLGSTIWAIDTIDDGSAGLYPSEFVSDATDFKIDVTEFPEDFTSPGNWSEFRVTAASAGWRFDDKLVEALQQMISAGGGFDAPTFAGADDFKNQVEGMVKGGANDRLKKELLDNNPAKLEYCPQVWTGIDCTGLPYSSGSSPSLKYDSDALTYEPVEVGTTTLKVETMPIFGAGKSTGETKNIETRRLEVYLDPFQATLDVSTDQGFVSRVDGEDQTVEWTCTWNQFTHGGDTANLRTPDVPWETPIEVTIKSKSNTGLREGKVDSDPRTKTAYVTYGGTVLLQIVPSFECIGNGETVEFEALAVGLEEYTIIWKIAEGWGSIVSTGPRTGLYTAPPGGTTSDRISAEIEGVEDVIDYARVEVGACNCRADISVTPVFTATTAHVAYLVQDFGQLFYQFFFMLDDYEGHGVGLSFTGLEDTPPAPGPGETGTWPASFVYFNSSRSWGGTDGDGNITTFITVTELTDIYMVGTVHGTATAVDNMGNVVSTVQVYIPFRAGLWADDGWPCN